MSLSPTPPPQKLLARPAHILCEFDACISIAPKGEFYSEIVEPLADFVEKFLDPLQRSNLSLAPPTTAEEYSVRRGPDMKKEDARLAVLREYDRWAKRHPNDAKKMGGFVFFRYLEKEKPDLLDFRAVGSKWQIVHLWLRHGGRLED